MTLSLGACVLTGNGHQMLRLIRGDMQSYGEYADMSCQPNAFSGDHRCEFFYVVQHTLRVFQAEALPSENNRGNRIKLGFCPVWIAVS